MYHRHNAIGPVTAIEKSCNVYFYAVADRLGVDRMEEWYSRWSLGDETLAGVPHGVRGIFRPNNTEIGRLLYGIGQDDVAWTPMHAAIAYTSHVACRYYLHCTRCTHMLLTLHTLHTAVAYTSHACSCCLHLTRCM